MTVRVGINGFGLVVPEPAGALDGMVVRVPVEDGLLTGLAADD